MNDCKHSKHEVIQGIEHAFCRNKVLKEINKSDGKDIPCMGSQCGQFEPISGDNQMEADQ